MAEVTSLQILNRDNLKDYIFETLNRMYRSYDKQRAALDPRQMIDVRYEELIADPVGQLERVYAYLGLPDFEYARPAVQRYADQKKSYQANMHELDESLKQEIRERWAYYFETFGYA
jgi:hypothetical protein